MGDLNFFPVGGDSGLSWGFSFNGVLAFVLYLFVMKRIQSSPLVRSLDSDVFVLIWSVL